MVCLYSKTESDFNHNGTVLEPSVCNVTEEAGGSYELYLEHPFDPYGKYLKIEQDMIIKAPVPKTYIPEITLPARSSYKVNTVDTFYEKLPVPKQKESGIVAAIRADPESYMWMAKVLYNAGAYVSYQNTSIYVARRTTLGDTPGSSAAWAFVAGISETPSFPGTVYSPGLELNEAVTKLADYNSTYSQVRDLLGRVGYYKTEYLTFYQTEPQTIPAKTITTQLFRIYSIESEEETGVLNVYAKHISYDLAGNTLMDCKVVDSDVNNAIAVIQASMNIPDTRTIACEFDDSTKITQDWSFKNPVNALLDPDTGLVPTLNARLIRNNRDYYILKNDNPKVGAAIEYGINLRGVNWSRSVEQVITRVIPRCKASEEDHLFLEHGGTWDSNGDWVQNDEQYVESPIASEYPYSRIEVLDCAFSVGEKYTPAGSSTEQTRDEASCRTEMLKEAQKRFTDDHCDHEEKSLSVEFTLLGDTEQYKQYKDLQSVNLYDNIPIKTAAYSTDAQVVAYEFDSLRGRYNSIEIGNVSAFRNRVPGFRVVNESITYAKLSPEVISMIRTMGSVSGSSTGSGGGSGGGTTGGGVSLQSAMKYADLTQTNIAISSDGGYATFGTLSDFGLSTSIWVTGFYIRGWSGAPGSLSVLSGSNGQTIYIMSSKAGTISSASVRLWYFDS